MKNFSLIEDIGLQVVSFPPTSFTSLAFADKISTRQTHLELRFARFKQINNEIEESDCKIRYE